MRVTKIKSNNKSHSFSGNISSKKLLNSTGKYFSKFEQIGEGANIALDFVGKAVLVPAIIMSVSREEKEKKRYSAIKNPIGATIQLLLEVPLLWGGSNYIGKLANSGKLDSKGTKFSYNEKNTLNNFFAAAKKATEGDKKFADSAETLLEKIKSKGFSNIFKDEFDELINAFGKDKFKELSKSFEALEITHKRLYHLQNRLCFGAALILTPLICGIENFLHPKVMKLFKKSQNDVSSNNSLAHICINNNISDIIPPWVSNKHKGTKCQK